MNLKKALKQMNKGKSPDIDGLVIEHIIYAGEATLVLLLSTINHIFQEGVVPDSLKTGILTPIYKNKGDKNNSKNYRGITVLPVLGKVIECILRNRIQPLILEQQSAVQRGFTANVSPLNAALILEEVTRESKDQGNPVYLIFLDAKAAFDVVDHNHLMRRLYHTGIKDSHWTLIDDMHRNATSIVKWAGKQSEPFEVCQGVRQGGILSSDLYKVHINPALERLRNSGAGFKIGNIFCGANACADDLTVASEDPDDGQIMLSESQDFSSLERFDYQLVKSVSVTVNRTNTRSCIETDFELNGTKLAHVNSTTHLGIKRSTTLKKTGDENVQQNITKSRRTAYSLLASGLHGTNGLDPRTAFHLVKIYILPVLLYGLEIIQLNKSQLEQLELYQKKLVKQILSVPTNTRDAAVYILSGLLPVEAQIHKKKLTFFNNVCHQPENSIEKQLAVRQSSVKSINSNSWFIEVKKVLWKYDLGSIDELISNPLPKQQWKNRVNRVVNEHWKEIISAQAILYKPLKYINLNRYQPGEVHKLVQIEPHSTRDVNRISTKLKFLCGAYTLQSNRSAYNKTVVNPTCQLCGCGDEDLEHFILNCSYLEYTRNPIITVLAQEIDSLLGRSCFQRMCNERKLNIILDSTVLLDQPNTKFSLDQLKYLEFHTRRLLHNLAGVRYRTLKLLPKKQC